MSFETNPYSLYVLRMMDPIVLYYGKGQLTGFLVDPNGVLDVVINLYTFHKSQVRRI